MDLSKYVPPERFQELTAVHEIRAARTIMDAVAAKLEEMRKPFETGNLLNNPEFIKDNRDFKLGMIAMARWILDLPTHAERVIRNLPE